VTHHRCLSPAPVRDHPVGGCRHSATPRGRVTDVCLPPWCRPLCATSPD